MNFKRLFVTLSLFMVLMCCIGAISAASDDAVNDTVSEMDFNDGTVSAINEEQSIDEDSVSDISPENDDDINEQAYSSSDKDILKDDGFIKLHEYNPDSTYVKGYDKLSIQIYHNSSDANGKCEIRLDDNVVEVKDITSNGISFKYSTSDLSLGQHTLKFSYYDDLVYPNATNELKFNVVEYYCYIPTDVEVISSVSIGIPSKEGIITFYVDGEKWKSIFHDMEEYKYQMYANNLNMLDPTEKSLYRTSVGLLGLSYGVHNIKVVYSGGGNCHAFTKSADVNVRPPSIKITNTMESNVVKLLYGMEDYSLLFKLPSDATGDFVVSFLNKTYTLDAFTGYIYLDNSYLEFGDYEVTAKYLGNKKYPATELKLNVSVVPSVFYNFSDIFVFKLNQENAISLKMPKDANGTFLVKVDGEEYANVSFVDGFAGINITNLSFGVHEFILSYTGNDYTLYSYDFKPIPYDIRYIEVVPNFEYTETVVHGGTFSLNVLDDNVNWTFQAVDMSEARDNRGPYENMNVTLSNLKGQQYCWYLELYSGNWSYSLNKLISILPLCEIANNRLTIETANPYFMSQYYVYVDDKPFATNIYYNGKITLSLSDLTNGKHNIKVFIEYVSVFTILKEFNVTIKNTPSIVKLMTDKDLVKYYPDTIIYKVKLYLNPGEVGAYKTVTFKYNKKTYKFRTDGHGVARIKISGLKPNKYTITASYRSAKVSNKMTVKNVLTLKSVKVKKSAKKLVLTASLKKGSAPIKNKLVTFKFNGKSYKAKTNAKGIAKATVSKSDLNKLKIGKKVAYQSTYSGYTIKKSAVVSK